MKKTLNDFLTKHDGYSDVYKFAKDLTLEEFLDTCNRGDWILWLFAKSNPHSLRELTLAKAHCANTARHLMRNQRSKDAVDIAIKFGEGKATKEEMLMSSYSAYEAYDEVGDADDAFSYAAFAAFAAADEDGLASHGYSRANGARRADAAADAAFATYCEAHGDSWDHSCYEAYIAIGLKQTADICRKYLPLQIWNIK